MHGSALCSLTLAGVEQDTQVREAALPKRAGSFCFLLCETELRLFQCFLAAAVQHINRLHSSTFEILTETQSGKVNALLQQRAERREGVQKTGVLMLHLPVSPAVWPFAMRAG